MMNKLRSVWWGRARLATYARWALCVGLLALVCGCGATSVARGGQSQGVGTQATSTYVAIGASDAFGVGTRDPDRQSWPTRVAAQLGAHTHLINLGIPGETAAGAQGAELPVALDARPDVVTVWLGVNDLTANTPLSDFQRQLGALLSALRQGTQARIVVGNLPDLTLLPSFARMDQAALSMRISAWNAAIASVCAQTGVTLVDLYAGWSELAQRPEYISEDGLHPSALGAQRLADIFSAAIRTARRA